MKRAPTGFGALALVVCLGSGVASAQASATPEFKVRCATRLSAALLGKTPSATLLASTDPQSTVATMLTTPEFIENFARFVNASFNRDPGVVPAEDASYYLAKYILQNNRPWKEMFVGPYRVDPGASSTADAVVVSDTAGLGYFRSRTWMVRYAGNELDGYRIVAAYRMMNNVLGIKLQAAVNTAGVNSTGRMQPACAGCHYNTTFGLDYAAKILSRRVGTGATMTFTAPTEGAQPLLDTTIANDSAFVNTMVNSLDFRFHACRLATEFVYARPEFKCEGPVFDSCMTTFATSQTIQSAIATIAKDPGFCQ
jgi:hypothetical protein